MELPPAEHLLDLRDQFALEIAADERQWEYFYASPNTGVIQPTGLPRVLFRGQGVRYSPSLTSLARGLGTVPVAQMSGLNLLGQAKLADRLIRRIWFSNELENHPAAVWLAERRLKRFDHALAQHYGIPTGYMDLSESFDVSCFFATCYVDETGKWQPHTKGAGIMYLLPTERIPIRPDVLQPIGLQVLPRPREQFGWVVVCGISSDFEDIPGLQMLEFEHSESVGRHFLQQFSGGADLFPPDAMAEVADKIMTSTVVPASLAESIVSDLCGQEGGLTAQASEIRAAMVGELGLSIASDITVLDDRLRTQAEAEWSARSQHFLRHVGFRLARSRPRGASVAQDLRQEGAIFLSPTKLSDWLTISLDKLARIAGMNRVVLSTHPETASVQAFMRGVVLVITGAESAFEDRAKAIDWLVEPLATFGHKTALQLIAESRTDDVVNYLESIASGFVG